VIDVSNDGHVTNVGNMVHKATDLIDCEVDHLELEGLEAAIHEMGGEVFG
jgi:hypothetical protein